MRTVVRREYGTPEVIAIEERDQPELPEDRVFVRVHATSVNAYDWHQLTGLPLLMRIPAVRRPTEERLGVDFAGTVERVGAAVTRFRPGDEVFGSIGGAFAEYLAVRDQGAIARKPPNLSFVDAACVACAGLTALQGVRDKGKVRAGQRVLVNGAAGGVGTFAVQIAKAFGADVTAVCSARNVEMVRSLGADRVVDYTTEDFTRLPDRFDVMLNIAGGQPWSKIRRVLAPHATVVIIGGPDGSRLFGPLGYVVRMLLGAVRSSQRATFFISRAHLPAGADRGCARLSRHGPRQGQARRHHRLAVLLLQGSSHGFVHGQVVG
jgi:NADPH:quinone reductase-like Zn-dependent oxidoreductase